MPVTLKSLADTLGIAKSTVIYNAKQLGIYDDIKVVGGRGTRVLTDEQAALLAHAITGTTLTAADLGGSADIGVEDIARMREQVDRAESELAERERQIDALKAEADDLKEQVGKLEAEIAVLRRMREIDQDCIARLMHAWPWKKKEAFEEWKKEIDGWRDRLLPPAPPSAAEVQDKPEYEAGE